MTNTCTVDNLLYMLFLSMRTRPFILRVIEEIQSKDVWLKALLDVYQHLLVGQWEQGKISWLKNVDRFKGEKKSGMHLDMRMTLWFPVLTISMRIEGSR